MAVITINTQVEFDSAALKQTQNPNNTFYELKDAVVECDLSFNNKNLRLIFENIDFKGTLNFLKHSQFENLNIEKCSFQKELKIENGRYLAGIKVDNSKFTESLILTGSLTNEYNSLQNNIFNGKVDFNNSTFEIDTKNTISNNQFKNKLLFENSKFKKNFIFYENTILNGLSFKKSRFEKSFIGNNNKIESGLANFESVYFGENSFLTQSVFSEGIRLYSFIPVEVFDVTDIIVEGNGTDRESARILKNLFLSQNNRVNALIFHELEMKSYKKELLSLKNNSENAKTQYKRDYLILRLNELSTNFGLDWKKGVKFTLTYSIILYIIYILSFMIQCDFPYKFGWNGIKEFWEGFYFTIGNYFEFLWPTHKFNFIEGTNSSALSNLFDIIGRIVTGFGIYQTIQAFRKLGKF